MKRVGWMAVLVAICTGTSVMAITVANGITTVVPASATQGDSVVVVTMTLDSTAVPSPPLSTVPSNMRIGTIEGVLISRSGYDCTATFNIPAGEVAGFKMAEVYFPDDALPPPELSFQKANGFEVLPAGDQPVIKITTSGTVVSNDVSVFMISGTNNFEVVGFMVWSNALTGASGSIPVSGFTFKISDISLHVGGNLITVFGTNDAGVVASDSVSIGRYPDLGGTQYGIVDTAQSKCFANTNEIAAPAPGAAFHGQDAQTDGAQPNYIDMGDSTVLDINTDLLWQKSPDTDGDGDIDADDKLTLAEALVYAAALNSTNFAGYSDWRVPGIKELYSLILFTGGDPSSYTGTDDSVLIPYIDTAVFDFAYGDQGAGERIIDSQYASSNIYVDHTDEDLLFGVNFADGRIKGYGMVLQGVDKTFFVICCRGNTDYGANSFTDNGDGTITDHATGLMWDQNDTGSTQTWESALAYVETLNASNHLGYSDWRMPNIKELQSILDYSRSPGTTASPAINPLFNSTSMLNEENILDWGYYWSSTTHMSWNGKGSSACYMSFGRGLGYMNGTWRDVHGAGCQRSDSKTGDPGYFGPQGDAIRVQNFLRVVRDAVPIDSDGDGMGNGNESIAGTDPYDDGSVFAASIADATISWPSADGRSYTLEGSSNLAEEGWFEIGSYAADIPENNVAITNTNDALFYRIKVEFP